MSQLFAWRISPRTCGATLIFVLLGVAILFPTAIPYSADAATDQSYWLTLEEGVIAECAGDNSGKSFTASSNAEAWVQVTGVVTCKDSGSSYTYDVNFIGAEINPEQRANIGRESLVFDWIGLVVYGPNGNGGVDWLYDDARPIRGSLRKDGKEKIYFGNLKFSVPKEKLARADHFVFYLTAQGALTSFNLLGEANPSSKAIQRTPTSTADSSYWLALGGGRHKIECAGDTSGQPFRASNYADSWVQVTGVVTCKDNGDSYAYEVNFISAEINPEQRASISRESLVFDWMGLAIYGSDGKGGVNWLYDDALPIRGSLRKEGQEKIYFGNLKFNVAKEKLARADHLVFYLTTQGALISVYVL
jgi:hypothetical protein